MKPSVQAVEDDYIPCSRCCLKELEAQPIPKVGAMLQPDIVFFKLFQPQCF